MAIGFFIEYLEIFFNGTWKLLIAPQSETYNPSLAAILMMEIIVNAGFTLAQIFLVFLFCLRKKSFPKWFIGAWLFTLIFFFADALAIKIVLPNKLIFDHETSMELARIFIVALIWSSYMLFSKRVKATFVR